MVVGRVRSRTTRSDQGIYQKACAAIRSHAVNIGRNVVVFLKVETAQGHLQKGGHNDRYRAVARMAFCCLFV